MALVTTRAVVLLSEAPAVALAALADALSTRGLSGFIDTLVDATGTTASSLPEFAVAIAEERGIRVAVRGASTITDASGARGAMLTGVGVTGWSEAVWDASSAVEIASPESATGGELWVVEGAVRAASVLWSPSGQRGAMARDVARSAVAEGAAVVVSAVDASSEVRSPDPAVIPLAESEPSEPSEPSDSSGDPGPAGEDDHLSLETLAPAYDTVAPDVDGVPRDTMFGSLWGATASSPPAGQGVGAGPFISSVPDFTSPPSAGESATQVRAADESAKPPAPEPTPPPAPEPTPPPAPESAKLSAPAPGDHDGATMSIAALRAMTSTSPALGAANGASTPAFASAEQLAKERRGRAVVSTGAVVTLDKNVIVGRTPKASRVTGEMPHLVTVPSPSQDISRSHVELRVEGTAVVAVDLNTTNGTMVRRDGMDTVRLHPGEPHVLLSGDTIDLGDGVTITLEDLP